MGSAISDSSTVIDGGNSMMPQLNPSQAAFQLQEIEEEDPAMRQSKEVRSSSGSNMLGG
jgi:hypothetical protein